MDIRDFKFLIKELSNLRIDSGRADYLMKFLKEIEIPGQIGNLASLSEAHQTTAKCIDEGFSYWYKVFNMAQESLCINDVKEIIAKYVIVSEIDCSHVKSRYNIIQAVMKCTINETVRAIMRINKATLDHALETNRSIYEDIAKDKGYNSALEMSNDICS